MLRKIRSPLLPVAYFSYAFKRGDLRHLMLKGDLP
ncbi:hypothetical protein QO006_002614 [Deinococcus enclensis]|uniref:Rho-GAP domain-containing protein n=1 Tax=Deinococcus enclensis TaxID=1049582 RepID=A0ABT9MEX8_9DEIO|nr:hypothetical protein [Deinococcus enclensis]